MELFMYLMYVPIQLMQHIILFCHIAWLKLILFQYFHAAVLKLWS